MTTEADLRAWERYCANPAPRADKAEFATLLMEDVTAAQAARVFAPFSGSDAMTRRLMAVKARIAPDGRMSGDVAAAPALLAAADAWRHVIARILRNAALPDLADRVENAALRHEGDPEAIFVARSADVDTEVLESVGDMVRDSYPDRHPRTYALFEALYNVRADYPLAWYVGAPLLDVGAPLDPYFELWSCKGQMAFVDGTLLVGPAVA